MQRGPPVNARPEFTERIPVQAITPAGSTSIGNGLQLARSTLDPVGGYDYKALLVFTDGHENTPLWIADVSGTINDRTFAIGLGTAQQVSAGTLTALTNHTQGYLLLSGPLSPSVDDYFRLTSIPGAEIELRSGALARVSGVGR